MSPHDQSAPAGPTILLIDDEIPLLKVHCRGLTTLGYTTLSADGGEKGLQVLEEHNIDLVILDMLMPGMDGVETLRRIRERNPNQAVVILSAYAEPEKVDAVKAMGVLAYLKKPLPLKSLAAAVEQALAGIPDRDVE